MFLGVHAAETSNIVNIIYIDMINGGLKNMVLRQPLKKNKAGRTNNARFYHYTGASPYQENRHHKCHKEHM